MIHRSGMPPRKMIFCVSTAPRCFTWCGIPSRKGTPSAESWLWALSNENQANATNALRAVICKQSTRWQRKISHTLPIPDFVPPNVETLFNWRLNASAPLCPRTNVKGVLLLLCHASLEQLWSIKKGFTDHTGGKLKQTWSWVCACAAKKKIISKGASVYSWAIFFRVLYVPLSIWNLPKLKPLLNLKDLIFSTLMLQNLRSQERYPTQ